MELTQEFLRNYIGYLAATLTTLSFVPQAIKTLRTGNTEGISLTMYITFCLGVSCWLAYGVVLDDPPMILANCITLVLAMTILGFKVRNEWLKRQENDERNR